MNLPALAKIRQKLPSSRIEDVAGELRSQLDGCGIKIHPGSRIAIATGSRGIVNIPEMIAEVARWVKSQDGQPFVVPAMGSHGGATAEGQQRVLESYGITESAVGAPIRSSMEVAELPQENLEVPAFFDRNAFEADGVVVVNRIKPHTDYHGPYESGLMKMIAIGLGKEKGAQAIHTLGVFGLREVMPKVAVRLLAETKILLGIGVVEDACDETCAIRAIPAADIPRIETELLDMARANMPSLPVDRLDILIIDEIGKNISGIGLDSNIVGRMRIDGEPEPDRPAIRIIVLRDLTAQSHGNAIGLGMADIVTRRLFEKIDFKAMYDNAYAATFLERAKVPVMADTDREAIRFALRACGSIDPASARVIRIRNTLRLDELHVSPAVMADLSCRPDIEVLASNGAVFDEQGALMPF